MTESNPDAAYELRSVSKAYELGGRDVHAVQEVSLTIAAGEFVAIAGPSGSGKTTLLQLLGALDRPTSGEIHFEGRDIVTLRDRELGKLRLHAFGFVFQQFNLIPTLTAAQNVEIALAPSGVRSDERRTTVMRLLDAVGLAGRADHVPGQLSGGEQQRVAIARALANEPHVLLADEPTGNLDSTTGTEIMDLLLSLSGEGGRTVIVVTHDGDIAGRAERVLRMHDGRLLPSRGAAGDRVGAESF
ncbi:MAG: ABC transporter ATP-binding protein [Thermoleophilia bacterium]|nr:ABC transporter ATP-binding protein [Thermoleophilia bacterium]MDH4340846.1 ABC transporter ATP-binding protein [Thermoleophilia bacterium]MDH5280292.1 ABC transporter ATP-binding protein [Thermoleophilia bacterium]